MKRSSFRFLWIGQSLANGGDLFYIIGLLQILYDRTGSATIMTTVPFAITFSRLGGGVVAPWVMDRFPLQKILVSSQGGKSLLLYFLVGFDLQSISILFPLISAIAFLDGWATPTRQALLPRLVSSTELVKANSWMAMVDQTVQLGGWAVGGVLAALLGGPALVMGAGILFTISTALMARIQVGERKKSPPIRQKPGPTWSEGWLAIRQIPSLRTVAVIDGLDGLANVVWIAAILYLYVEEVIRQSEVWWGLINAAFFAGLLAGGLLGLKGESAIRRRLSLCIGGGTFLLAVFTLCFGYSPIPWLSLILSTGVGVATQIKGIGQQTVIQWQTSDPLLPKVFAAREWILTATFVSTPRGMTASSYFLWPGFPLPSGDKSSLSPIFHPKSLLIPSTALSPCLCCPTSLMCLLLVEGLL